jgi:hypothetical protein
VRVKQLPDRLVDAPTLWLLPEEVQNVDDSVFEELLADLKESLGE